MRHVRIRWDLAISLFLATLLFWGLFQLEEKLNISDSFFNSLYKMDDAAITETADNEIGGYALENIPRVSTYEELCNTDSYFTMEKSAGGLYNYGSLESEHYEWRILKTDDDVLVAAIINSEKIQEKDNLYILPVGTVRHEQPEIAKVLQEKYSDKYAVATDLYIDMDGEANYAVITSSERMGSTLLFVLVSLLPIIFFALYMGVILGIHAIGVKIGIFPPIIRRKN